MGRGKSLASVQLIDAASDILEAIEPAGVRAVCYQLFNRKLLTSMAKNETNRVSTQLRDARERGVIPWHWIVDDTREAECVNAWENPAAYVETVKRAYRRDRWTSQPKRIEVWSEKGTVRGTLAPVLDEFGVTFRIMHGYGSATAIHDVAVESAADTKPWDVLYVGDWDPSGLHMSEVDLPERLRRYGGAVDIDRVALTADQCLNLGPLPSFRIETKRSDPRYRWFLQHYSAKRWGNVPDPRWLLQSYGTRCWELDALSPAILRQVVADAIRDRLDLPAWEQAGYAEAAERESLVTILNRWPGISRPAQE